MAIPPNVIKEIASFLKKHAVEIAILIKGELTKPDKDGKSKIDHIVAFLREEVGRRAKVSVSPEAIKLALSYVEKHELSMTMEDLIKFVKGTYKLTPGDRVCIYRATTDVEILEIMAVDTDNNPIISPTKPWSRIYLAMMDSSLVSAFGGKDLLVLK